MPNLFRLTIEGHLGRDPKIDQTKNGKPVAYLSVAVTEKARSEGGEDKSYWYQVSAYGIAVDQCRNLKKGDAVLVETETPIRAFIGEITNQGTGEKKQVANIEINTFKVIKLVWFKKQEAANNPPMDDFGPAPSGGYGF